MPAKVSHGCVQVAEHGGDLLSLFSGLSGFFFTLGMYHFYRNKEYIFKDKRRVVWGRLSIPTLGGVSEEVQNIHQAQRI